MNTLPDDVREKILAIINSFESEVIRHDDPEYVHRVILNEDYPNLADKIMEEYAKAYAPVPGKEKVKVVRDIQYWLQKYNHILTNQRYRTSQHIIEIIEEMMSHYLHIEFSPSTASNEDDINPETGKEYFSNLNPKKLTKHFGPLHESSEKVPGKEEINYHDKLFELYTVDARNDFVNVITRYFPHEQKPDIEAAAEVWTNIRVACEDILIAYDQMKEKLLAASPFTAFNEDKWKSDEQIISELHQRGNKMQSNKPKAVQQAAEKYAIEYAEDIRSYIIDAFLAGASFNKDAVEFAEWAYNNYKMYQPGKWRKPTETIRYTTQELYNLYLDSIKQIKQ